MHYRMVYTPVNVITHAVRGCACQGCGFENGKCFISALSHITVFHM